MRVIILLSAMALGACGSKPNVLQPPAEKAVESVTCPQSQSHLFNVLYASLTELRAVPTEDELKTVFREALSAHPETKIDQSKFLELVSEFYRILLATKARDSSQMLEKVTALEVGDRTTLETRATQDKLNRFIRKWDEFRAQQIDQCDEPSNGSNPHIGTPSTLNRVVYGARKALVIAYQSCEAGEKDPMDGETEKVVGIKRIGTHPDGVGGQRVIADLRAVQKTHYYLQTKDRSSSCKDISSNPMIYDYGGKPYATSDPDSALDFFKNAGSGTRVLGIDCSAYVFSALAAAGLKIHPDKKMKAILSHGINARMYMDPANNGLACFRKATMGVAGTLQAGDIAAVPGHVVVIDSVGKDPFGIERAKTVSQCAHLDSSGFDFVIAQSSPSKNAIGINKYQASDYLAETGGAMKSGFEASAQAACKAKFDKKNSLIQAKSFQIIRHKLSPECIDRPLPLVGESCAASCQSLADFSDGNNRQTSLN